MATDIAIASLSNLPTPASADIIPIVDVSDLTDPGGTTKGVLVSALEHNTNLLNGVYNPLDPTYGAVGNGVTDDTAAILATITALNTGTTKGGMVWFAGTSNTQYAVSGSLAIPKRAAGDNFTDWYILQGLGRGGPRILAITGLANLPIIDASGQDSSTYSFYREFKQLYLAGNSIAQTGIDIRYNEHFKLEDLFINGLVNGSGQASGVNMYGAICSQILNVKVHNSQGHGLYASGGSGGFFNANLVAGCSFLGLTGDGMYFSGGASGCTFIGNTHESCNYGARFSGYSVGASTMSGCYFEQNAIADILLGDNTTMSSFVFLGNYLNGYAGATGTAYTPIQLKLASLCTIQGNEVAQTAKSATGYYILDANMAGGSVTNCTVTGNSVKGLTNTTPPNQIYNLPGSWVDNSNSLIDSIFAPLIQSNLSHGLLPSGGWTLSVAGAGTAARGAKVLGGPSIRLTRPAGGDTASMSQIFPIGPDYKNRFVTVAVPVVDLIGSKACNITITPNGTSPQVTTLSVSTLAANGERIGYSMGFAPSDATQITVTITAASAGSDFLIGQPCLYPGATQWYSNACDSFGYALAAPTTGTWVGGDIVLNALPAASGVWGWVCTVSGTPGTWLPIIGIGPNLAVTGAFGANGATPQTAFASGGAAPAGGTGATAGAYDTSAHRDALITLVNNMRTALVSNGIMT